MSILAKIVRHPTGPFMISLLTTISTALGCGVMPPGQATTRTFTVTGFTLPVAMAYAGKPEVSTKVHGIAANEAGAQDFVSRLVMHTVFDVLERQGRSAFLPDAVISTILGQLNVTIAYRPLGCNMAVSPDETLMMRDSPSCVIVSNTVTGICTANNKKCSEVDPANVMLMPVPSTALTIGGTLSNDVAKCSEQSGSNVGIAPIWAALLRCICRCQRKLNEVGNSR
ncbi:hypothetical protein KIN20_008156 [Parelaphostrongylus tenuis]|uniref:Lipoprotein n=1 Tax=Parelaphostrongylus tenuis TaxID=148309 RepID=A0AAD5MWE7_PARTN|nr:hypothetical protein KIN20_008156 [Parelaphostrongylus tenuis]